VKPGQTSKSNKTPSAATTSGQKRVRVDSCNNGETEETELMDINKDGLQLLDKVKNYFRKSSPHLH
jgi:hypothetical protein